MEIGKMDISRFHNIISNPHDISIEECNEINTLLKEYPYCSTLHLLYLKGLHTNKQIGFKSQLKKSSIHIPDRSVLYRLLFREKLVEQIKNIEGTVEKIDVKLEVVEPTIKKSTKDISPLEEEIIREAINSSIQLEVTPSSDYFSKEIVQMEKESMLDSKEEILDEETSAKTELKKKHSFLDWLELNKNIKIDESTDKRKNKRGKSKPKQALISQFIQEDPRITPAKKDFFSPSNSARISLVDNEEFVTETLARIYCKQGSFDKAIKAYESLSLKFPEKSTYFADLIKEVKENRNK